MADPAPPPPAPQSASRLAGLVAFVGTGLALGLAIGRAARLEGASPLLTAACQAGLGGLLIWLVARRRRHTGDRWVLSYCLVNGGGSIALPNGLIFWMAPQIGLGLIGMAMALSPILTALFARAWGQPPGPIRLGPTIALGLAGVALAYVPTLQVPEAAPWLALSLLPLIPAALAFGNVHRTVAWPPGVSGTHLAAQMLLSGAIVLLVVQAVLDPAALIPPAGAVPWLAAMGPVFAGTYLLFFVLQREGGPVMLSQIGYVIAGVGFLIGHTAFGDPLDPLHMVGLALVALGLLRLALARRPPTTD
jgi:drug/metabolite transporter (DMT)-like permease